MRPFLKEILAPSRHDARDVAAMNKLREGYQSLHDDALNKTARDSAELAPFIAATAEIARRVLGERMFDVQLRGTLALTRGSIAEMQTGEGKTLTAVPAIAWLAREKGGVHVMTVNDYLARRDAQWMGEIYRRLGFGVGFLQQDMNVAQRRSAYSADIMYATANEIGFDFLRDRIALRVEEQVQGAFNAVVIDEADSILIDEARIPLVIASAGQTEANIGYVVDEVARRMRPGHHYYTDEGAHNVILSDAGIEVAEHLLRCGNLFEERNLALYTALQDAIHAYYLLRRDLDYVVKDGVVEMVDEFRGRVALDRRWPAGLHTAVEIKERVETKQQGHILGSITMQHLVGLYSHVCGMTGTAASAAGELQTMYLLPVEVIPTNRPMIRVDHPDRMFPGKAEKYWAVIEDIHSAHRRGQPVLVGTASVAESELLSRKLSAIPHSVLNAKNDAEEAAIIAKAGERGAVTISTNMAGRGTDIKLGQGVDKLGGLYVIGTNRHESLRIDNQLRGRAGRQGDPGCSRFFVSLEDDLMWKYRDLTPGENPNADQLQRLVEGLHLDTRIMLNKYELQMEGQRHMTRMKRQSILTGETPSGSDLERVATLRALDDAWADYLAQIAEFRASLHWISLGGGDPHRQYIHFADQAFRDFEASLPAAIAERIAEAKSGSGPDPNERGAVWTYVTTDQPFGPLSQRILRGLWNRMAKKKTNARSW